MAFFLGYNFAMSESFSIIVTGIECLRDVCQDYHDPFSERTERMMRMDLFLCSGSFRINAAVLMFGPRISSKTLIAIWVSFAISLHDQRGPFGSEWTISSNPISVLRTFEASRSMLSQPMQLLGMGSHEHDEHRSRGLAG